MDTPIAADTAADLGQQALEGRLADSATAARLAGELITRLEARVTELERVTARMRDTLQQLGQTVW
jgi:hypothetical protein